MTNTPNETERYVAGTFTPAPERASRSSMALAQGRIETRLFFRHGEQLLLNLVIPLLLLLSVGTFLNANDTDGINQIVPMVLAVAATSAGFTGQAISLAFDRRYGALKRSGASGVPPSTIIVGKIIAVLAMVLVQVVVLGATALAFGWRTDLIGIVYGLITLVLGVAAFTALGLLMGGSLSAELVLGLANLIWIGLVATVGWVLVSDGLADAGWFNLVPSVALASALDGAFQGVFAWPQMLILAVWAGVAGTAAAKWFRFNS